MVLAFAFVLLHLILIVTVADPISLPILARGISINFVLGWLLAWPLNHLLGHRVRYAAYLLIAVVLGMSHAHVAINGSFPDIAHAGLALDKTFLGSVLADRSILIRILLYAGFIFALLYLGNKFGLQQAVSAKLQFLLIIALTGSSVYYSYCANCESFRWQADNVISYNLLKPALNEAIAGKSVFDGRVLIPKEAVGERLHQNPGANVIVLLVEGLSQHHLDAGYAPELSALVEKGLSTPLFITHQRQTNRGLFSVLCGAYPNLVTIDAKSDLMGLGGLAHACLPHTLQRHNYHTVFMQAAPLGYMSKDLFADKAGFSESHGDEYFSNATLRGEWGVDDKSFYTGVIDYIKEHKNPSQPYFMTLLTSGTHPPFNTPVSKGDRIKAFEFASHSAAWFYQALKEQGLLDNTLFIITSDESSAGALPDIQDIDADNRGFLLALADGIDKHSNSGVFGQLDIPVSILDYLNINQDGFGGRSIFQRHEQARTLYAGNTFKHTLYVYTGDDLLQCSHAFECARYENYLDEGVSRDKIERHNIDADKDEDIATLINLIALNDISSDALEHYLVSLPRKTYSDESAHPILGRFVSSVLPADSIAVSVKINNDLQKPESKDLQLIWVAFDCADEDPSVIRAAWKIPAGIGNYSLDFRIEQVHKAQCHKVWVATEDGSLSAPWMLEEFLVTKVASELPVKLERIGKPKKLARIAHAGGEYNGLDYTNSYEALNSNLQAGFNTFEIDFSWTSDGQLVCTHDWGDKFTRLFGFALKAAPSLEQFRLYNDQLESLQLCEPENLSRWLAAHPETRMVTDIKSQNLLGLTALAETMKKVQAQIIPQIYQPSEFSVARKLGYDDIIWTLYRYSPNNQIILNMAERLDVLAITMPESRAKNGLAIGLKGLGIPTYVHTINDFSTARNYMNKLGVSEIYTDTLSPLK